ncbi:MAG: PQQ-dependent sugar dehydrogenase [Pseudomonadota bacterium]
MSQTNLGRSAYTNIFKRGCSALGILSALALVSCDTPTPAPAPTPTSSPTPANNPPVFTSSATLSIVESTSIIRIVYQATATDAEGSALSYAISGGEDAARFTITSGGALTFNAAPNFEAPADADRDNVYKVRITVSDGAASTSLDLTITVTNSFENAELTKLCGTGTCGARRNAVTMAITGVGAGRLDIYVGLLNGIIAPAATTAPLDPSFADISDVGTGGDRGVISMTELAQGTPAPGDPAGRGTYFLVMYANAAGDVVLRLVGSWLSGFQGGVRYVIPHSQYNNNYGGWVGVGPDGNIYVATGDGGGTGDPLNTAQDPASMLGKVLRFSPDFSTVTVVASGFRNPNGGFFHNNMLILADRGQDVAEEINLVPLTGPAGNYGWPYREGTQTVRSGGPAGMIDPIAVCGHNATPRACHKLVGGVVYDGTNPSLQGTYIFGDRSFNGAAGAVITLPASRLVMGQPTLQPSDFEWRGEDMFTYSPDSLGILDPTSFLQRGRTLYMSNFYPSTGARPNSEVYYLGCKYGC